MQETKASLKEGSDRAAQAPQEHPNGIRSEEAVKGQKAQGREPRMVEPIPTGEANDVHQLLPMPERMNQSLAAAVTAERPGVGQGNARCWSDAGLTEQRKKRIMPYSPLW